MSVRCWLRTDSTVPQKARRLVVVLTLAMVTSLGFAAPAQAAYSPVPKATWAANGTVFAIAVEGSTVYLGGKFTRLRNPATGQSRRAGGLAALDRSTGDLLWTATANGEVRSLAVSQDGARLFVGGAFTQVNGSAANHLVALNAASGTTAGAWDASASGTVRDLVVSGGELFVGGQFKQVKGAPRSGLAKLDTGTGTLRPWTAATGGGRPWAITLAADGDSLIVGGNFTSLGGKPRRFLGSVSTSGGAVTGWAPPAECDNCYIFDIDTDADTTYATSGGAGGGRLNAYGAVSGNQRWTVRADGNIQAVAVHGGLVYAGGHFDPTFGGHTRHQLAAVDASTGAVDGFAPNLMKPTPGVWAIAARADYLFVGGGFTGVGQATEQARFAQFPTK